MGFIVKNCISVPDCVRIAMALQLWLIPPLNKWVRVSRAVSQNLREDKPQLKDGHQSQCPQEVPKFADYHHHHGPTGFYFKNKCHICRAFNKANFSVAGGNSHWGQKITQPRALCFARIKILHETLQPIFLHRTNSELWYRTTIMYDWSIFILIRRLREYRTFPTV